MIDITGIELTPSEQGKDCIGNGEHFDENNNPIECCCDECSYYMHCFGVQKRRQSKTHG